MVGIVIVSHSATLAAGVLELASGMSGPDVELATAGGMALPDRPMGTDANLIVQAIEQVYSEDGVIVLMDLGSAVISAEMALEMLPADKYTNIVLCAAPLVEGAVSAAINARMGNSLDQVVEEARNALVPKIDHLGSEANQINQIADKAVKDIDSNAHVLRITVTNPMGLHARPASRFVQTAGRFPETEISVRNLSSGKGPVNARSINSVATLGVSQGQIIKITALGPQAELVLAAYNTLAAENFGDNITEPVRPVSPTETFRTSHPSDSIFNGISGSRGIAIGPACHFHPAVPKIPTDKTDNPEKEWKLLMDAIEKTREEIKTTLVKVTDRAGKSAAEIFTVHLLFLDDEALLVPTRNLIFEEKCNGADAWNRVVESMSKEYRLLDDEYFRERAVDILNVGKQVIMNFLGTENTPPLLSTPGILIVSDLTPADTVQLDPSMVKAICTAFGGPTSHSVILARSFGIPSVVGLGDSILDIEEGTLLVVDAEIGQVIQNPDDETVKLYTSRVESLAAEEAKARAVSAEKAVTIDGKKIGVNANIGSITEVSHAVREGAEGIGLFRTEFLFLGRQTAPDEKEQFEAYCEAAKAMNGRPVIIRTLDVGGDKPIPYLNLESEENPFLGRRAIRMCLARPDFFKVQLRAIVRAASLFPIKVMFPMIATLEEFRSAKSLLMEARDEVKQSGQEVITGIDIGIMVEIPAVAICAEKLAQEVDFFSIGTNDLTQYTMAAERGNSMLAELGDPLHPAILKLIKNVVDVAHLHGKKVSVCGEAGGDPLAVPILIGLGVDELSMNIPAIPRTKVLIRGLEYSFVKDISRNALKAESAKDVRRLVESQQSNGLK